jgi:circadian clock protein KaiB
MNPSSSSSDSKNLFPPGAQDADEYLENFEPEYYKFRLYVSKKSPGSMRAIRRIKQLCEEYLSGHYDLEIVDIHEHPELLQQDQVFAVPTLIKQLPPPLHRLIGDLSDTESVMGALGL